MLADWRSSALRLEQQVEQVIVGQRRAIRLLNTAVFARGHVLLEGDVGVGKTTLLRTFAHSIGGAYERIEGTIDLMPNDLVYYTYINEEGKPRVEPGPVLKHGNALSIFFFNEVNRARPQVHSLLLRIMEERSLTAFNQEYSFPHLQIFADRNRIEKEETFELPSAARDRFLMEVLIEAPNDDQILRDLMFETRFHDVGKLIISQVSDILDYTVLNTVAETIQTEVRSSRTLEKYAVDLCRATRTPSKYGISMPDINIDELVLAGVSPRGMSAMLRAARVTAWLDDRAMLLPEDIHAVFYETIAHRVFYRPVYELRRSQISRLFMQEILNRINAP